MKKRFKRGFSERKVAVIIFLFALTLIINIFSFFFLPKLSTGFGTESTASVIFEILGEPEINITHPYDNYTYNFSEIAPGPYGPFILDLNVTSNQPMSNWIYSLYDVKHDKWPYQDVAFPPNITFNAVRWENRLFVNASNRAEEMASDNVTFYVWYPNTAPILGPIDNPIYVCEGSSLGYWFYAEDADEELLFPQMNGSVGIFYIEPRGITENRTAILLYSGNLNKGHLGGLNIGNRTFPVRLEVEDSELHSDWEDTNITLLEINNPPRINPPLGLGVETIWNKGENSTFFKWINISDLEYDPPYNYGSHNFNLSITNSSGNSVNLFNIIKFGENGFINFSANSTTPLGNYNVLVCVNDTGILSPHPMLSSICSKTGGSITTCDNFQLTITAQNRAPTIVSYYPDNNKTINVSGDSVVYFNISKYDPDGTIPDAYWYVDNKLIEYDEGSFNDSFYFKFECGISGKHIVKAEITDGELNDSVNWCFNVEYVACSQEGGQGGGGGGGGGVLPSCIPLWGCNNWGVCQHAKTSLEVGLLSGIDYRTIEKQCLSKDLDEVNCGFQIRSCMDFKNCNSSRNKPEEIQWCHYTERPSCKDKIKNCHDGECELLIDCGGPCGPCPSCTDGIRNQGEEGKDCGGPCPWKCKPEIPFIKKKSLQYVLLFVALVLIIIIIIKLLRVFRYRKRIEKEKKEKERFK